MKAIISTGKGTVALHHVTQPEKASYGHLIIKMVAMGINAGDQLLISGNYAPGFFTQSQHNILGVSGVGRVIATGQGVPEQYAGKMVTVYRSLTKGDEIVGTWSEYAHLPYLQCAILPDDANAIDYAGSLVNIITAYAAWKQAVKEGHKGIVVTAGNSDTGKAMLGFCQDANFPILSLVRNEAGKQALQELGAEHVLVQDNEQFQQQYEALAAKLGTTAVFDGVGGTLLSELIPAASYGTTVYAYGFLGGNVPISFHTGLLMKGITLKGFSNFNTETVQDLQQLSQALEEISKVIHLPHFKFNAGQSFGLDQFAQAIAYKAGNGSKALLVAGGL